MTDPRPPKGSLPLKGECSAWFTLGVTAVLGVMLIVFLIAVARAG